MESRLIDVDSPLSISVAIATYNRASMVAGAIRAALTQSRAPLEVIVSDDASTDHTLHVVARMARADGRVKLLREETNSGGVGNWNRAVEATRGELIAWCSDDDWYRAGHLQASAAYLEAHPEVGLVHSGFVDWMETSEGRAVAYRPLRTRTPLVVDRGNLWRYLTRYYDWPFHPSTIVMRRRVWRETGPFDPSYALADTDWFVRAALQFPVAMLARYGVNNRRHPGNWSNRLGSARMQEEIFEIVERALATAYPTAGIRRSWREKVWWKKLWWKEIWRANVRLHLLLTVRARLRSGHPDAAGAAWRALFGKTGVRVPSWFVRAGERWLRAKASRAASVAGGARESVSPL